jgi:hypothetical protein
VLPHDRFAAAVARFMKHYLSRCMDRTEVMIRAISRYPGVDQGRLEYIMNAVMAWGRRMVPVLSCTFASKKRCMVWPDDYVSEDDEFRAIIGYRDDQGKFHEASLVLPYREGLSLQEAFDDARQAALDKVSTSEKIRELIEYHLEQLRVDIIPRMGPIPPMGTEPTAEF